MTAALLGLAAGWSFGQLAIAAVVLLAVVALVYIAARAMGVPVPGWLAQAVGVVVIAFVIIVLIRLVLSL